jgi:integration host factor subunit alpha
MAHFGRREAVLCLMEKMGWSAIESTAFLEAWLEQMKLALLSDDELKISGFGTFSVKQKKERLARNPKTGEPALVSERCVVRFLASKQLNQRLLARARTAN